MGYNKGSLQTNGWDKGATQYTPSGDGVDFSGTVSNIVYYINSNTVTVYVAPIVTRVYNILVGLFSSIADTQQADLAKATFPLINLYIDSETCLNTRTKPSIRAYNNILKFRILAYDKLDSESSNTQFEMTNIRTLMEQIQNILRFSSIDFLTEIDITSIRIVRDSGDIFIPNHLEIDFQGKYCQDSKYITRNA